MEQTFVSDIRDLHIEAVLDGGFFDKFALESVIHSHSYHELMLCREGQFTVALSNRENQILTKGQLCLIPAGVYHHTRDASPDAQKLAIRFHCTENGGGSLYRDFTQVLQQKQGIVCLGMQTRLTELTEQLRWEIRTGALAWEVCIQSVLQQLFVELLRLILGQFPEENTKKREDTSTKNRRVLVEFFLHSHCAEDITEEDLAEHMHISKRQLSRVLQQLYGTSFRKLLIDVRMSRAVQLLGTTDFPAEEIAAQVGYHSVSGFYDAFRKKYGVSVGCYRQQKFR